MYYVVRINKQTCFVHLRSTLIPNETDELNHDIVQYFAIYFLYVSGNCKMEPINLDKLNQ
jgi:hypothetical protein